MFNQIVKIITKLGSKSNKKIATEFNLTIDQFNNLLNVFNLELERLKRKVLISPKSREIVKFRKSVKDKKDTMDQANIKLLRVFNTLQTYINTHQKNTDEVH